MKVKKFVAPSMPEAMKMIRAELGNDAVILNSKVVRKGGFLGLFTKKNIEVIAAVDPQPARQSADRKKEVSSFSTSFLAEKKREEDAELLQELKELKMMLKQLSTNVRAGFSHYPGPLNEVHHLLATQEVSAPLVQEIMADLLDRWYTNGGNATEKQVFAWAKEIIKEKLSPLPFGGISFQKKYINVVGPTGVGKTTTLAKIAAHCVLHHRKNIAFITTDTYRIAAIDQLKTYAKILNVPLEVCYNLQDFHEAKKKLSDRDIVLIDTAGRNFRHPQYVKDLQSIIDFDEEMETFLVFALTAKYDDMKAIYEQFSLIPIDRFIFTKLDETTRYGAMLNLMMEYKVGASYLTNGQNVPDDMMEASVEHIINMLFGVERV
ncbi:flagellar biosynthesis protein FlhF [Parageobacillus thermoglucosidasius]|uniref:flagellar biosynthesis protein FlhF n=1 Tax=Parageobacillus thermoglucosidasius TaxID=1426 RepID=UPI000F6220C4|nr:flagellar biosynthesis protein FlhF [Parageobacillus thermoglucosidasius]GCD83333.1 flagellar biosynthesis protein FlhF [Parageobacillus thermoglucosidasius]